MHMLYTEPQIARSTLAAVRNRSTLSRIVNQDFSQDFIPGRGGAITIKSPVYMAAPGYTPQRIVQLTGQSPTLTCTNRTAA